LTTLSSEDQAAFDGERICITNASARSVSLWKATDLSPITSVDNVLSVDVDSLHKVTEVTMLTLDRGKK
jgi:hypothetical protein